MVTKTTDASTSTPALRVVPEAAPRLDIDTSASSTSRKPSPTAIIDSVNRIMGTKARTGASGPSGDPESRAAEIVSACESELRISTDKQRTARLHFEIAAAYDLYLDDEAKALGHYQKSLESSPHFLPALRGARRLLLTQKSYPSALKLLDVEIRLESAPGQKAMLNCLKGRILEDQLHQQTKARQCYLQAKEMAPGSPEVLDALIQVELKAKNWSGLTTLLEEAANTIQIDPVLQANVVAERARLFDTRLNAAAEAAELYQAALTLNGSAEGVVPPLKRLLYKQSRWRELVDLIEKEIADTLDVDIKVSGLLQINRIYAERLGNRERAVDALQRAHQLAPRETYILESLGRHLALMEDTPRLIEVLKRLAAGAEETEEKVGIFHRIGQLYDRMIQDPVSAVEWHEQALVLAPDYIPSLRALGDLYQRLGRWDGLINMYLAEASATTNTLRRADAHVRIAELYEYQLGNPSEAAVHHAEALSLAPGIESSFKALVRIYTQARQYTPLIKLYESAVEQTTDDELKFTYLFKIGAIYEDSLNSPALAADTYRRILRVAPKHLGAIHALERAAEAAGKYRDVVDALRKEVELTRDTKRQVALHQKIAEIYDEKLEEHEPALAAFKKVLDLDGSYAPALAGIGRLYNRLGRWQDLREIYGRELKLADRKDDKLSLLMKLAELSETHIGDEESAVKYYRRAITIDSTFLPALHALNHNLEQRGDFDTLTDILQTELKSVEDSAARARVAYRLGEIYENNKDSLTRAAEAYKEAVNAQPTYRPALDALARVNSALKRYQELAEQLTTEASDATDERYSVEALLQAGIIYSDHLNDIGRAISAFETILTLTPHHLPALSALVPLYRESGASKKLSQVFVRLTNIVKDPKAKTAYYKELARVLELSGDTSEMKQVLSAVLSLDDSDAVSLLSLERIALAARDWSLLSDVDSRFAKLAEDPQVAALYLSRMAQSVEASAPNEAMNGYTNAIPFDVDGLYAVRGLAQLADSTGAHNVKLEALRREAAWTQNAKKAADLLVNAAELSLSMSRDIEPAVRDLKEALERCPEHKSAAERLYQVLVEARQYELLIDIFTKTAGATADNAKKSELLATVARLHTETQKDIGSAIAALKQMLTAQPNHLPTLLHLAKLYKENRQWDEAAKILETVIKQKPKRKVIFKVLIDVAAIYLKRLDSPSNALAHVETLLKADAKHVAGLTLLCEIQFKKGNLDAANAAAEKLLQVAEAPETKSKALLVAAQIRLKKGARKSAAKSFREAITIGGPSDSPWAKDYYSLLGKEESWEDYLDALMKYNERLGSDPDAKEKLMVCAAEISRVQHEGLGKVNDAVATLEYAMQRFGRHPLLRYHLAKRLAASNRHEEASAEINRLIAEEPTQTEMWRLLAHVYRANGLLKEGGLALSPIMALGEATAEERSWASKLAAQVGFGAPNAFSRQSLWDISPQTAGEDMVTQLLTMLEDALTKVYPPELDAYGITVRDRVDDDASHPLRLIATQLSSVFGITDYHLYLNPSSSAPPLVELTQPVSILVPASVMDQRDPTKIFVLARLFAYVAKGQHAALRLGNQLEMVLAALTQRHVPSLGGDHDPGALDRLSKRVMKATSWRGRRQIEEAVQQLAMVPGLNISDCLQGMETCAARAAAIISGDLAAAAAEIKRADPSLSNLSGKALMTQSGLLSDLFSFWMSKPAMAIRKRAGLI